MPRQDENMVKVTVLLPLATVVKLDQMAQKSMTGSRGRAIESIVASLDESRYDVQQILTVFSALVSSMQSQPGKIQDTMAGSFGLLTFPLSNILRRLNQFLGVQTPIVVPQPMPQPQSQPQPEPATPTKVTKAGAPGKS